VIRKKYLHSLATDQQSHLSTACNLAEDNKGGAENKRRNV